MSHPAIFALAISAFPVACLLIWRLAFWVASLLAVKLMYNDLKCEFIDYLLKPSRYQLLNYKKNVIVLFTVETTQPLLVFRVFL
ncbi:hypothetical protein CRE_26941 [Caenorhabditis remanei]|uniref:Uncharacterized protein n=1 Tax=Caenorhabditis remanei TaxID=31234 RepID=E3LPE3_CAERE|nr:hypothetical protein CRE_26941 [Caenorhabditis remanei]